MLEYRFTCPLPHGFHARPATQLAKVAGHHNAQATLINERTGTQANAASVLDLVAAGIVHGDPCLLRVDGEQAAAAYGELTRFIEHDLVHCDGIAHEAAATKAGSLPRVLQDFRGEWHAGVPLSPGLGWGQLVQAEPLHQRMEPPRRHRGTAAQEQQRLAKAIDETAQKLGDFASLAPNQTQFDILMASRAMLLDAQLAITLAAGITRGATAEEAVQQGVAEFKARLAGSASEYLRQRQADMEDIGWQLLKTLQFGAASEARVQLPPQSILCATSLSPAQFLALDTANLAGLVLGEASATSHTVILARAQGKAVLGGVDAAGELQPGATALLEARRGVLLLRPSDEARTYYEREQASIDAAGARRSVGFRSPLAFPLELGLNVAAGALDALSVSTLFSRTASGVGLCRTETLFAGADAAPPSETAQLDAYRDLALLGPPVIIRTFDIGGDKPVPCFATPAEANPFLGQRGLRLYPGQLALLRTQLRAICRASGYGTVSVMAPMVSTADEACWFREQVQSVQAELQREGQPFDPQMRIGAMLEVPSATLAVAQLSRHCDFFSIGTNDLCQYFFAADRGNPSVAGLNNVRHPAFLRLLKQTVDEARGCGRWIGLCGEMASELRNIPLLAGLGLDEISLASPLALTAMQAGLAGLAHSACCELLAKAIDCGTSAEVEALLDDFAASRAPQLPLLERELVRCDAACATKAEVLRELVRLLYAAGRTDDPDGLEDALWAREAEFSTGLGHGMAIPHCKSSAAACASLAVLRLSRALDWQALDGQPVDMVLMLTMPEHAAREHLAVFAKLARKLMDESFRDSLRAAPDAGSLLQVLRDKLELE